MQKGDTECIKRMSDADHDKMAKNRNKLNMKESNENAINASSYDPRKNSPGKRAKELEEDAIVGKIGDLVVSEGDIEKMIYFVHSRMPSSLKGEKGSMLEDVVNYLNLL